jgi:hypothetical protein
LDSAVDFVQQRLPFPQLPIPSLWFGKRLWLLKPESQPRVTWRVEYDGGSLSMTGDYALAAEISRCWQKQSDGFASKAAESAFQLDNESGAVAEVSRSLRELKTRGSVSRSDFVFIGATAHLGAILAEHFNHELRRVSRGDLCVAAPLGLPPKRPNRVTIYKRVGRHWIPYGPENGLCMQRAPGWPTLDTPGLSLAVYLRAVAKHYSDNGRFHE